MRGPSLRPASWTLPQKPTRAGQTPARGRGQLEARGFRLNKHKHTEAFQEEVPRTVVPRAASSDRLDRCEPPRRRSRVSRHEDRLGVRCRHPGPRPLWSLRPPSRPGLRSPSVLPGIRNLDASEGHGLARLARAWLWVRPPRPPDQVAVTGLWRGLFFPSHSARGLAIYLCHGMSDARVDH